MTNFLHAAFMQIFGIFDKKCRPTPHIVDVFSHPKVHYDMWLIVQELALSPFLAHQSHPEVENLDFMPYKLTFILAIILKLHVNSIR